MDETEGNNLGSLSESLKDLIRAMLVTDPSERITLAQTKRYLLLMRNAGSPVTIQLTKEARKIKERQMKRNQRQLLGGGPFVVGAAKTKGVLPEKAGGVTMTADYAMELPLDACGDEDSWWM